MEGINPVESKNVIKNFLKMGVSAIAYLRNLFAESIFEDATIAGLPLKRLTRATPESSALIDWIDCGIYDALGKEYLKALAITIHDNKDVPLESYNFSFNYDVENTECGNSEDNNLIQVFVSEGTGANEKNSVGTLTVNKDQIKTQTIQVLRDLILLIQSLSPLPENRFISMKLLYYDAKVPKGYEPPFFRQATATERAVQDHSNIKQDIGMVRKHLSLSNI
ncbi:HORMA domain-containing protein [Theileria equi strain WA]|uniref:HORMA domain-containing protein n=1 Tax=Theileria equi strain WA TaxID=1537102 RepID=L0B129_THEEQ|nr:HORMA domain-containing protein [Theileria equi strain WA]AFZ81218.1 HORMA domain-containing protein [Theileria equi strain WA]|eukprot:XP_004830884.1 HORMA domain-containing protein [Theileria equi strain WA]